MPKRTRMRLYRYYQRQEELKREAFRAYDRNRPQNSHAARLWYLRGLYVGLPEFRRYALYSRYRRNLERMGL